MLTLNTPSIWNAAISAPPSFAQSSARAAELSIAICSAVNAAASFAGDAAFCGRRSIRLRSSSSRIMAMPPHKVFLVKRVSSSAMSIGAAVFIVPMR